MAIEVRLGKLTLAADFHLLIPDQLSRNDIQALGISLEHVAQVTLLPVHHRDPFDQILITQAIAEEMPILSADNAFDAYPVTRIW